MADLRSRGRQRLRDIGTFADLVNYLHSELDWPIDTGDFDDLTFDYTPEELGIDPANAAKIVGIKRMRPLTADQPWGIFFVDFDPKRLPVVALRRILNSVVTKKRASATSADHGTWDMDDLMFISSFGESDMRQISFAHFSQRDERSLPELKVLGWDARDTALHLDHVVEILEDKLRWPDDDGDLDTWRQTWSSAFTLRHREVITTSQKLAVVLAELARKIRDRILSSLAVETEDGPLTLVMKGFREALIHDLTAAEFADMYAQTIAYGLLSARIVDPSGARGVQLPVTNPFLRELLEEFLHVGQDGGARIEFDELGVNEVIDLLDEANMEEVVKDFGDRNPEEDPVVHFYERFLAEYDPEVRMQRGVFYTPRPVVSFIVRSVDEILRTEFSLPDGLADTTTWGEMVDKIASLEIPDGVDADQPFVRILDPATGTGTFLVEVIDLIHETLTGRWRTEGRSNQAIADLWNEYVPADLLPRLFGFEILMAPYAIAHLKIGLKLLETGYQFDSEQRANIYLTNALEDAPDVDGQFDGLLPSLAHEAEAVSAVKSVERFTVVVGNPPYSKLSANLEDEHRALIDDFRYIDGERIKERGALALEMNLQDDYVKFVARATSLIARSTIGVVGYVTNNGYLSTPTLRGMRWQLLRLMSAIDVVDLHGHSGRGERDPEGDIDENVFDIQQGVGVSIFQVIPGGDIATVRRSDLYGSRQHKYSTLSDLTISQMVGDSFVPEGPNFLFYDVRGEGLDEYQAWDSVSQCFELTSDGIVTARDGLVVAFTKAELVERLEAFRDATGSPDEICREFGINPSSAGFDPAGALSDLRSMKTLSEHIIRIQYRPFDYRYLFYRRGFIQSMRSPVTSQVSIPGNLLLAVTRQVNRPQYEHAFVSRVMFEKKAVSHDRNTQVFPALAGRSADAGLLDESIVNNYSSALRESWKELTGVDLNSVEEGVLDPMFFMYAVLYSPGYRERYFPFLKSDFPAVPFDVDPELASQLVGFGRRLAELHLLERPGDNYDGVVDHPVEAKPPTFDDGNICIAHDAIIATGVSQSVWDFRIGGYQVLHKWLKDRKGRVLSEGDIIHYQKIVAAISDTIRVMSEIDETINRYGGWPDAFQTVEGSSGLAHRR